MDFSVCAYIRRLPSKDNIQYVFEFEGQFPVLYRFPMFSFMIICVDAFPPISICIYFIENDRNSVQNSELFHPSYPEGS
jgi:hypothetical protein